MNSYIPRPQGASRVMSVFAVGILLFTVTMGSGCAKQLLLKRATLSTDELDRVHTEYIKADVLGAYNSKKDEDQRRAYRDSVVSNRMRWVNAHYEVLVREFHYGRATKDFTMDAVEITLDSIGALTGTAASKATLHAISGGLTGANAAFDKNFYFEQTTPIIVQKMDELRAKQINMIKQKLLLPTAASGAAQGYSLPEALEDVDELWRAGSISRAIFELSKSAGAAATQADAEFERDEKGRVQRSLDLLAR